MADNVYVDPGSGAGKVPVATDDVSGVHYPYVKLDVGADGAASHVVGTVPVSGTVTANAGTGTMAVSGPVTDAELRASAVPVSAASLPLPSGAATAANQVFTNSYASSIDTKTPALGQALAAGSVPVVLTAAQATALAPLSTVTANLGTIGSAATEATLAGIKTGTDKIPSSPATAAKQPALGTAGTPSSDVITVQGVTSMTPLKTDGSGVTQPVSGTVTANAGSGTFAVSGPLTDTQLRASAVPISAASLPLPSSAATSTKQSDGTQKTQVVDGSGNVIGATANALDVNIKSGASSGTQYTEADTDASITGTAVMWEDTSDTLRAVSAAKPLPVNVVAGGAGDGAILDGVSSAIKATVLDYTNANPIAVRLSDTNGDYVSAGAGTQYTEDAAAAADPVGGALILVRADTPAATVSADGDNIAARGTNKGEQYVKHLDSIAVTDNGGSLTVDGSVTVSGTVTANAGSGTMAVSAASLPLPSGASTAAKQPALGTAGTPSADVITVQGVTSMTALKIDGSAVTQPVSGPLTDTQLRAAAVPISAASLPLPALAATSTKQSDGTQKTQVVDGSGNVIGSTSNALDVNIKSGSSSGTQYTEADTDATITGTAVMWEDTGDTLRSVSAAKPLPVNVVAGGAGDGAILDGVSSGIKATVLDYTNSNPLAVRLTDTAGDYVGAGAGTQYTEDAAAAADPTGTALIMIRADSLAAVTSADGDNIAVRGTNKGELYVKHVDAIPVTDNSGSLTVDNAGTFAVQAAQSGTWNVTNVSGTVSLPTGAATSAKQDTQITAEQAIQTSVELIDDAIKTDDAAFTPATTKVMMAGFEYDDTTPDSVDEGDAGAARMSARREIYTQIRDAAGNERGVNVNSSNQLAVSVDNTVTVASHAVTNAGTFAVQLSQYTPASGRLPVDGSGVTQPISGTVTANAGTGTMAVSGPLTDTQLRATAVPISDGGGSITVDGSVTATVSGTATVTGNKAEDAAAADGDAGLPILGVRNDAAAARTSADGDYGMVALDSAGRVGISDLGGAISIDDNGGSVTVDGAVTVANATAANLKAEVTLAAAQTLAALTSITNVVHVDDNSSTLSVDDGGGSITVDGSVSITGTPTISGTVTANAGTNLNTSALALESGGNLATIAAAIGAEDSASADLDKGVRIMAVRKATPANTSGADGDYEIPQMSAGRLWVSAAVDTALPAGTNAIGKLAANDGVDIGDVTINNSTGASAVNIQDGGNSITVDGTVSITANSAVNVAQINGVTPLMGAGNTGTGSPRVTIASDQASIPVAATLTAETTKVIGTVNIAAAQTVATVTTVSTVTGGGVAHDGADSGNPIKVGGRAISAEIAAVANNDRVDFVTDLCGKQIVLLGSNPENLVSGVITSAMTGTTSTSLVAAPGAGLRNYITQITVSNAHATVGTDVIIQDGSGGTTLYTIPAAAAYGGAAISFPVPLRQPTTNTALYCANVTTGASTKVSASGFKGA